MPHDIPNFLNSSRYSATTCDSYRRAVTRAMAEYGDLSTLTAEQLRRWLYSQKTWGDSQRYLVYSAVRAYLSWRYGPIHPALSLKIKVSRPGPQRTLDQDQVRRLLETFDTSTPHGTRNLAITCLLLDTGLRASEVCNLEYRYLDLKQRSLSVIVKGGKWGSAVYSEYTRQSLISWLPIRTALTRPKYKFMFCGIGGTTPGGKLTVSGLRCIIRQWGVVAGIGPLSTHDFRRTFATLAVRLGAPTRLVQLAGRWSNLDMVERYTQALEQSDFEQYFPVTALMRL